MAKGQLPKAYLRLDPNIDQTHPDVGAFVRLLCAGARQPRRGVFRDRTVLELCLGKRAARAAVERHDVVPGDGRALIIDGWDIWQEGDYTVGERMRRYREKHRHHAVTNPVTDSVTLPSPPSETVRQQGSRGTSTDATAAPPPPPEPAWNRSAADVFRRHFPKGSVPGAMYRALKPLVAVHGWPDVERELGAYLQRTAIDFHNWPKFAAGYGRWEESPLSLGAADNARVLDEWEREVREGKR